LCDSRQTHFPPENASNCVFGRDSTPTSLGKLTALPQTSYLDLKRREGGKGKGSTGEKKEGKPRGMEEKRRGEGNKRGRACL